MSVLLLCVGIFAIIYTNRMQQKTIDILEQNVSSQKAAEELEIAFFDMKGWTANYLIDGQQIWLEVFSEKQESFLNWFENARKISHTTKEDDILNQIERLYGNYLTYQKKVIWHKKQGNQQQAQEILTNEMRTTFDIIYEKCEELLFTNEKMMYHTSYLIDRDNHRFNRIMYGVGILGVLLGLTLGMLLARNISHSIYELVLNVKGATDGEIVEKVEIAEETELEDLGHHIRKLVDKVHEVNKDLEHSRQMLIRSEKLAALGQMSAGLAHEIRNPLTAIKMLIFSLQKEATKDTKRVKDYQVILKEIERMENFLQNFLDFARPPTPNFDILKIDEVVKQATHLLSPQLTTGKVHLTQKLTVPNITVYGDEEQLQQVLVNIILNSIQSMPSGGELFITTTDKSDLLQSNNTVQVLISDKGSGIPPEIMDTIFDPFVTGKDSGTGLGLSIAYQIIRNHNGWIEANNNVDSGATFKVYLPIKQEMNHE